jgi:hypothetical protein
MDSATTSGCQTAAHSFAASPYALSKQQLDTFWSDGFLGPLVCDHPNVGNLPEILYRARVLNRANKQPIPDPATWPSASVKHINVHNPHRAGPEIMTICTHPSIVNTVAQVLGCHEVAFFQSCFRVKFPGKEDAVPWHQDVGEGAGGYRADGSPIPSITVWLSVDGAADGSGSVRMLPGTHTRLYGDWRAGINSNLQEGTDITADELAQSVPLLTRPGDFYILHSWTLHRSLTNASDSPRSAIVLRFVAPDDAVQPGAQYTILSATTSFAE